MKAVYFAWVRERIGKDEEEIEPPPRSATVADLVALAGRRDEAYAHAFEKPTMIRAALDRAHVKPDARSPARAKWRSSRR